MAASAFGIEEDDLEGGEGGEGGESGGSDLSYDVIPEDAIEGQDGVMLIPDGEGGYFIGGDEEEEGDDGAEIHSANLALFLEENYLNTLGDTLAEAIEQDKQPRGEWETRLAKGIEMVGVAEETGEGPFKGASRVVHPVLAEAIVQFQSRAIAELFPAGGPAKAVVLGKSDEAKVEQAKRVENYLNYQYVYAMPEAFWEMDNLLMRLPLDGSCFKKVYADPLLGRPTAIMVTAEQVVVNYAATSLESASRYTHVFPVMRNDLLKQIRSGFYREVQLEDSPDILERSPVKEQIDAGEGKEPDATGINNIMLDIEHEIYECYCDWDLKGFEAVDEETNEPTGIGLPYIITIEKQSRKVLAIRRNWRDPGIKWSSRKNADPTQKRCYFVHYKFLPGFGFYGYGFLHMIGGLAKAATGALRQLLDSGKFANLQGGFKSKDAKMPGGDISVSPGQWVDVESAAEDLAKSFFPMPYKEPSQVLFELLGFVVNAAQRFATTTETMVGDADNRGPVGTTVALIEQGSKVFSAIHKRCHKAQGEELRMVAELDYEVMLATGQTEYPYEVEGESRSIMVTDFDGRVDIAPVSDPNIFSATQRIAQAQAVYQIATAPGSGIDRREAEKRMLGALRVDNIDALLPDKTEIARMDPLSENMALMFGKAIRAYPDQEHAAHLMVHGKWFAGLPPEGQKMLMPAHMAHMAEHMAWAYRVQIQQALMQQGIQLPPPPDFTAASGKVEGAEMPPQVENQVAVAVAQAVSQMQTQMAPGQPPPEDPKLLEAKAKIQREDAIAQARIKREDALAAAEIERDGKVAQAEIAIDATKATQELEQRDISMAHAITRERQQDGFGEQRMTRKEIAEQQRAEREARRKAEMGDG